LVGGEGVRRGGFDGGRAAAVEKLDGGEVPVRGSGRVQAGELRWNAGKMMVCSEEGPEVRRGELRGGAMAGVLCANSGELGKGLGWGRKGTGLRVR
jgi:hypothetical protein